MRSNTGNSITSAELVRNFAVAREMTSNQPLIITNHGRATHVLMTTQTFESNRDMVVGDTAENPLLELGEWLSEGIIVCDRDLKVTYINRVAAAAIRMPPEDVIGKPFGELPGMQESHVLSLVQRTNQTNEPATVDVPSPLVEGRWTQLRCFPWRDRNAVLFRDITDRFQSERMADAKRAILEAMNEHGKIGYARVSLRGTIEVVDEPFAAMVGLSTGKLLGVPFINLCSARDRVILRDRLEAVMSGRGRDKLTISLMSNVGEQPTVVVALAPLVSQRGIEGAVAVITPLAEDGDESKSA